MARRRRRRNARKVRTVKKARRVKRARRTKHAKRRVKRARRARRVRRVKRARRVSRKRGRRVRRVKHVRRARGRRTRRAKKHAIVRHHSSSHKAMHIKSNPGVAGLIVAAKALAPVVGVGAVSMAGLAFGGRSLAKMIVTQKDAAGVESLRTSFAAGGSAVKLTPYVPAISTAVLAFGAYVAADKFAPKYKGAVVIGGLLGAVVQAVAAASLMSTKADSLATKAKNVLLGDYTTVGGRAYAEGGLFREIGDYTTVGAAEARDGGAYSNQRPRRGERDNATQWAMSGLGSEARDGGAYSNQRPRRGERDNATEWATNGVDDTTEFAPGEGGVLAGGLFRGSSR